LKWRFLTYPVAEYSVIHDKNCFSVGRVGFRGRLKELQVLLLTPKDENTFSFSQVLKTYKQLTSYDIISFSISNSNPLRTVLKKIYL
jgi:hypothetical protein